MDIETRALMEKLAEQWKKRAKAKYLEAKFMEDPVVRLSIEHSAMASFTCYRDLTELLTTGEVPGYFSFDVFNENAE